jgi:hypothetical protein
MRPTLEIFDGPATLYITIATFGGCHTKNWKTKHDFISWAFLVICVLSGSIHTYGTVTLRRPDSRARRIKHRWHPNWHKFCATDFITKLLHDTKRIFIPFMAHWPVDHIKRGRQRIEESFSRVILRSFYCDRTDAPQSTTSTVSRASNWQDMSSVWRIGRQWSKQENVYIGNPVLVYQDFCSNISFCILFYL